MPKPQNSDQKVFTAPLCTFQVGEVVIAHVQNMTFTENIIRARVKGIGELIYGEFPPLTIECSGSFSYNSVQFRTDGIPESLKRTVGSLQEFVDTLILGEEPISIGVYRRKEITKDPQTGLVVEAEPELFATIEDFHLETDSFSMSNESIGSKSQTFVYSTPIYYIKNDI
jgi:hypothetical protein